MRNSNRNHAGYGSEDFEEVASSHHPDAAEPDSLEGSYAQNKDEEHDRDSDDDPGLMTDDSHYSQCSSPCQASSLSPTGRMGFSPTLDDEDDEEDIVRLPTRADKASPPQSSNLSSDDDLADDQSELPVSRVTYGPDRALEREEEEEAPEAPDNWEEEQDLVDAMKRLEITEQQPNYPPTPPSTPRYVPPHLRTPVRSEGFQLSGNNRSPSTPSRQQSRPTSSPGPHTPNWRDRPTPLPVRPLPRLNLVRDFLAAANNENAALSATRPIAKAVGVDRRLRQALIGQNPNIPRVVEELRIKISAPAPQLQPSPLRRQNSNPRRDKAASPVQGKRRDRDEFEEPETDTDDWPFKKVVNRKERLRVERLAKSAALASHPPDKTTRYHKARIGEVWRLPPVEEMSEMGWLDGGGDEMEAVRGIMRHFGLEAEDYFGHFVVVLEIRGNTRSFLDEETVVSMVRVALFSSQKVRVDFAVDEFCDDEKCTGWSDERTCRYAERGKTRKLHLTEGVMGHKKNRPTRVWVDNEHVVGLTYGLVRYTSILIDESLLARMRGRQRRLTRESILRLLVHVAEPRNGKRSG